ncbi:MAG: DUF2855 family protein [Sphingobium sp.]|nr:DUF2855 family protein [Sphingobium sp.]MCP5398204.1 DUF2855 family protein [Sphingomonas sp.]
MVEKTAAATEAYDFLVRRDDLSSARVVGAVVPQLQPGQALLRIERYAMTANTLSYAASADQLGFWEFFPAPDGWGRVPTWGYAEVVESLHPELKAGERIFGYMPMSSHLVIAVNAPTAKTISDGSPHRAHLPAVYNLYHRDSRRNEDQRDRRSLLEPVFLMSFVMDDDIKQHGEYGAKSILIISASSKTSLGLAYLLKRRNAGEVVGLTSAANVEFTRSTGFYDRVVSYDDIAALTALESAVSVDMSGNEDILKQVHETLGDKLRHSFLVGITHTASRLLSAVPGDAAEGEQAPPIPGPAPQFAFGPDYVRDRVGAWGQEVFQERVDRDSEDFVTGSSQWMGVAYVDGAEATLATYDKLVMGKIHPSQGMVVRP